MVDIDHTVEVPERRCSIKLRRKQKELLRHDRKLEQQENEMLQGADHEVLEKEKKRRQIKLRKRIKCDHVEENVARKPNEKNELVFGDDYEDQKKALELAKKLSIRKQNESNTYGPQSSMELDAPSIYQGYADSAEGDADTEQNKVVITHMGFLWPLQLHKETYKPGEDIFVDSEDDFSDFTLGEYTKKRKITPVEDSPAAKAEKDEVILDETVREAVIGKGLAGALKFLQRQGAIMGSNIRDRIDFKMRKKNLFTIDSDMPLISEYFSVEDDTLSRSKEILIEAQLPDLFIHSYKLGYQGLINVSAVPGVIKKLATMIEEIYNQDATSLRFGELLRTAHTLVTHGYASSVYHALKDTIAEHVRKIAEVVEAAQDDSFLEDLQRRWVCYFEAAETVRVALGHLDAPGRQTINMRPSFVLALELWKDIVILSPGIHWRLKDSLLDRIYIERRGKKINRALLRSMTDMLMQVGSDIYEEDFERPFLEETADFYSSESKLLISCCDCDGYLKKAVRYFIEESEHAGEFIYPTTAEKLAIVLARELFMNHLHMLTDMESCLRNILVDMLNSDKRMELSMMYDLLKHFPNGHSIIRSVFSSYVSETGKTSVSDPERISSPVEFVEYLLNEKDKYDEIISASFKDDKICQTALISSFNFINLNNRCPEFISLYVDNKLRKCVRGDNEEDLETVLDKVMMLVMCLEEKDVFEVYYRQHLAKRLLSGSYFYEAERSMLVKLKAECGSYFTTKLIRMFTDMKTSHDTMQSFFSSPSGNIDCPSLYVRILTTGSWPTKPCPTCSLPSEILDISEKFRAYYVGSHSGRRLTWQTNMGNADITATFGSRKHELNVSTYQMCVLMLFNVDDGLTFKDIEQATAIPHVDLKRCLQSLACVKGKNVLRKEPMSKDIAESDTFYYNDNFSSKYVRVKIGTVVAQPEMRIHCKAGEDRKPQIEAAIVKMLKSRKVLDHNSIVTEVTKQLQSRFLPNPMTIKKVIESLIDRDYLKRDTADRRLYSYVP